MDKLRGGGGGGEVGGGGDQKVSEMYIFIIDNLH